MSSAIGRKLTECPIVLRGRFCDGSPPPRAIFGQHRSQVCSVLYLDCHPASRSCSRSNGVRGRPDRTCQAQRQTRYESRPDDKFPGWLMTRSSVGLRVGRLWVQRARACRVVQIACLVVLVYEIGSGQGIEGRVTWRFPSSQPPQKYWSFQARPRVFCPERGCGRTTSELNSPLAGCAPG